MRARLRRSHRDVAALALLALALTAIHLRGILPGQTFLPVDLANALYPWRSGEAQPVQNLLITDPLFEFYPYLDFAVDSVRVHHEWPLWNPAFFLGHPVVADPNFQPFYPVYLALGLLMGAARAMGLGPWLHSILAAWLMFAWVRSLGYSRKAALLAGLTYAASGQMITWFATRQWQGTLTWLPGVLWAWERLVVSGRGRFLLAAVASYALAWSSGQYQLMAPFTALLGVYVWVRTPEATRAGQASRWRPLGLAAAIVALGLLLNAIQFLPTVEFLQMSQRGVDVLSSTALKARQLITLLAPDFFGAPDGAYRGQFNYAETVVYTGLPALLLALTALAMVQRRRRTVLGLGVMALLLLYYVLGGPGVALLDQAPGFRHLSLSRSAGLAPLLIAPLAAAGLDAAHPHRRARWALLLALVMAGVLAAAVALNLADSRSHSAELRRPLLLAGVWLAGTVTVLVTAAQRPGLRRVAEWGVIGLVFADLFLWGSRFNPAGPIDRLFPATEATDFLQAHAGEQRVAPLMPGWDLAFGPNVLSLFDLAEPGGYSSMASARLQQLFRQADPEGRYWNMMTFLHPSLRLLDVFQVGTVASPWPLEDLNDVMERGPLVCDGSSAEITAAAPASGRFKPQMAAVNRMDLQFRKSADAPAGARIWVRLWQGVERDRLVLEDTVLVEQLTDGQAMTWYFAPETTAPGHRYLWEVSAPDTLHTGVSVCSGAEGRPSVAVYGPVWRQIYDQGIYYTERTAPMPRAYVVYAAETVTDDDGAVARLLSSDFDLRNVALTAQPLPLPVASLLAADRAVLTSVTPTHVVVDAAAQQPGLLVLGDLYHPGWQATVDGKPATIWRVNHVLRGVLLPAGQHRVHFLFRPRSLRIGAWISLAALGLLLLAAFRCRSQRLRDESLV